MIVLIMEVTVVIVRAIGMTVVIMIVAQCVVDLLLFYRIAM